MNAYALWSRDDLQSALEKQDVTPSDENIKAFINFTGSLDNEIKTFIINRCKEEKRFCGDYKVPGHDVLLLQADNTTYDINVTHFEDLSQAKDAMQSELDSIKDQWLYDKMTKNVSDEDDADIPDASVFETSFTENSASIYDPDTNNMVYWNIKELPGKEDIS